MSEEEKEVIIQVYNVSGQPIRLAGFGLCEQGKCWHMTKREYESMINPDDKRFSTKAPKGEASAPKPVKEVTE